MGRRASDLGTSCKAPPPPPPPVRVKGPGSKSQEIPLVVNEASSKDSSEPARGDIQATRGISATRTALSRTTPVIAPRAGYGEGYGFLTRHRYFPRDASHRRPQAVAPPDLPMGSRKGRQQHAHGHQGNQWDIVPHPQ